MGQSGMGLGQLKKEYEKLQKKHNLPGFKEMNEDFYIEKIAEIDTELLLTAIRRWIWEKFSNYMRLLEGIINPVNVPMFFFSESISASKAEAFFSKTCRSADSR